jgi:hypothetical protein
MKICGHSCNCQCVNGRHREDARWHRECYKGNCPGNYLLKHKGRPLSPEFVAQQNQQMKPPIGPPLQQYCTHTCDCICRFPDTKGIYLTFSTRGGGYADHLANKNRHPFCDAPCPWAGSYREPRTSTYRKNREIDRTFLENGVKMNVLFVVADQWWGMSLKNAKASEYNFTARLLSKDICSNRRWVTQMTEYFPNIQHLLVEDVQRGELLFYDSVS